MEFVYQALAQNCRSPSDRYADVVLPDRYELVLLYAYGYT